MLKNIRRAIVQNLWSIYRAQSKQIALIEATLAQKNIHTFVLDHFAIIDLPGPHTGIPQLRQLFEALGFKMRGEDYLAAKQNAFLWLAEADSIDTLAREVLPQVVVADFRLETLPPEIRKIIEKYSSQANPTHFDVIQQHFATLKNDPTKLINIITQYFSGRDWPLPTVAEFETVHAFNELLAWVLVFGRRPNHFTISVHLLDDFANLAAFHQFIEKHTGLSLNHEGGVIKGGEAAGIAQGSTVGRMRCVALADGTIELPEDFVEFVWRYPRTPHTKPILWQDYFTHFIAQHANHVIESLYE